MAIPNWVSSGISWPVLFSVRSFCSSTTSSAYCIHFSLSEVVTW